MLMYVFFAPPEQAPSRTWKVRGPKAEHFLASYSCAELIRLRGSEDLVLANVHPKDDGEGEEMDRTMSIGAAFALVVFCPACGMTLLVSNLAFATRAMREAVEQGRLPSGLPFYLRSACRAQNTPALRTHALLPKIRYAPLQGADSLPQASWGPFPQIQSSRLESGSRRHTLRASMYRRQRTNQKKRS
jgi:hypothetical protein